MKTVLFIVVSFSIATIFISTIHAVNISTLPPLIDDESCCKLELENLVDVGSQKFIPSSAIPALTQNGVETYFFITEVPIDDYYATVGAIDNRAGGYAYIWAPRNSQHRHSVKGAILANPNQCVVGWHVAKLPLADTNKFSHPKLSFRGGKVNFGRYDSFIGGTHWKGTHLKGIDMVTRMMGNFLLDIELLYVDCFASLKNQLWSKLYHVELDRSALQEGHDDGEEVVSSTEVTNNSNQDQVVKVDLDAEMFSSMEMTHESKLHEFSQTKWAVHGSVDLRWLGKVLASFSLDGGYDAKSIKENFTRTGSVSVESKRTVYKLNQEIKVKARTKTQVFIKTRPIRGDTQFTAYYKLKPRTPSRMWTHERIIASMRRAGFEDWDKTKTENGSLVMPIRGQLAIETGFETVAEVVSTPLGSDSPAEVTRHPLMPTR